MRKNLKKRKHAFISSLFTILLISMITLAHNPIPYSINWTNPNLIATDHTWDVSLELGVRGYSGSDLMAAAGTDARTVLGESLVFNVHANEANPNALVEGGVAEFEIANPTIALKGSEAAPAPYINLLVDSIGLEDIMVRFNVRDIDGTANDAVQQIAVQYRLDEFGDFENVPGGYIADATQGGTATLVTPVEIK